MSNKSKPFAAPKPKRSSSASVASSSRANVPSSTIKEKKQLRPKFNTTTAVINEGDISTVNQESNTDFEAEYRQIAYGKFLRSMLQECIIDDKIEREETEMDLQMARLADRFQKTMDMLDKTNRRLKGVSFVVEQKRLIDLKNKDCSRFYEMTEMSDAPDLIHNLNLAEQACLDKLETKNIDFGYDKDSGHKQLLDAVNEAIEGLEEIKKHSNLDIHKFKEFDKSQKTLDELERDRLDFESLKNDFEGKYRDFSAKVLSEATKILEGDDE